jgi:endoglucanase
VRQHRDQQAATGLFQHVTEAFPRREDWKLLGFGFQVSGWPLARLRIKNQNSAPSASETLYGARRSTRKNTVETDSLLALIRSVLAQPTAPFHEDAVRAEILMQLAQCPHVRVTQDAFGNVIAQYQRGNAAPRYAFAAHMDHPGFVGEEFLGSVPKEYLAKGAPKRDFGAFAMWDLPACQVQDGRIYSRACDDLISCAAILALFHELEKTQGEASVIGLFTRAEEVGFIGAIHLAKSGQIAHDITIVSLETSSERSSGAGRMGEGVIIRVGDRTSIFDDSATRALTTLAIENKLPHQRCLMSGGTCEATAYQLYGYRTGALCVALGNYHNCGPDTTIAAEFVSVEDVQGMMRLLVAASTASASSSPVIELREKLERGLEKYQRFG